MPPIGLLPLPGERLLPLALMFHQSCKNVRRRLPLRRVDQVIRKTLLKKLDDIRIRCFALHLPCEVTPKFVDQPPFILGIERFRNAESANADPSRDFIIEFLGIFGSVLADATSPGDAALRPND